MSVYRVIDVIGTSTQSWEDAAATAVKTGARDAPRPEGRRGGGAGVGGITLPAMRLSGTLTVGDIRDAVQDLRDFSLEETETSAGRVFAGA